MKTKAFAIIAVVTLPLAVSLIAQQKSSHERQLPESTPGDPAIAAKLEQIVSIREKVFKNYEVRRRAGRAPVDSSAAIELAEARIELAHERGPREEVVKEIMGLVAAHEQHLTRLQSLADRVSTDEIDRARASLLEAEVRLLRARN